MSIEKVKSIILKKDNDKNENVKNADSLRILEGLALLIETQMICECEYDGDIPIFICRKCQWLGR